MCDVAPRGEDESVAAFSCFESFLSEIDGLDGEGACSAIDDLVHRLGFERRWRSLAPNQLKHMEGELSGAEREALAGLKEGSVEFEELIASYARTRYFRNCSWVQYMNEGGVPPVEAEDVDGRES